MLILLVATLGVIALLNAKSISEKVDAALAVSKFVCVDRLKWVLL